MAKEKTRSKRKGEKEINRKEEGEEDSVNKVIENFGPKTTGILIFFKK